MGKVGNHSWKTVFAKKENIVKAMNYGTLDKNISVEQQPRHRVRIEYRKI